MKYTAVVLAGARPGGDPLSAQFGVELKALIPLAGEPMIRRPVRALLSSRSVSSVIVLTQAAARMGDALPSDARLEVRESGETIAATILSLCENPATRWPLLVTTADHALLEGSMVDEVCSAANGSDIAVGVVERSLLMRRLPQTRRTWLRFRGAAYTGANLFALRSPAVAPALALWRSVEQDRKKGWRLIFLLGPMALLGTALRLLTLDALLARAGRKLGITVRAVVLTDPLAGVDVDTPGDHSLVEQILAGRA